MKLLTPDILKRFLELATERLTGEWVLIGGTVLPILGIHHRTTVDIDLVGKTDRERKQQLKLMEVAEELGLPVETINQAGGYFLTKIKTYEKDLVLLAEGKKVKIFRPNLVLFLELKLGRFSDSDYEDCIQMIQWSLKSRNQTLVNRAKKLLDQKLKTNTHPEHRTKLLKLIQTLDS